MKKKKKKKKKKKNLARCLIKNVEKTSVFVSQNNSASKFTYGPTYVDGLSIMTD